MAVEGWPRRWYSAYRWPGAARRARHDAAGILCARHWRASVVDTDRLEWLDGHSRRARRHISCPQRAPADADIALRRNRRQVRHQQGSAPLAGGFLADKEMGEHFGWVDIDGDGVITDANGLRAETSGRKYGAIAVRPGAARGKLDTSAVQWRFQKNLPYIPAPLLYENVLYLVKTGGIVTSIDPDTGHALKEGRSPGALGEYYASPIAAEGKVFLANTEGKVTVLKAAGAWEVMKSTISARRSTRHQR